LECFQPYSFNDGNFLQGKIGKTDSDYFANIQFSLDTVIIDPGDEILFLKHQLLNGDMGKEGKYFFNFNGDDHTLEKINLDELRPQMFYHKSQYRILEHWIADMNFSTAQIRQQLPVNTINSFFLFQHKI